MTDDRLLTKRQLADRLGVTTRTLDKLIADGLPCVWVARRRRFRWSKVLAWFDERAEAQKVAP